MAWRACAAASAATFIAAVCAAAEVGGTGVQQRYYDPLAGRFLSLDQVLTDGNTGSSFNRYVYGLNNPYRYVETDGRDVVGINFKNYQVDTGMGFKLPLGHASLLLINDKTGATQYFECGRYDPKGAGIIGVKRPQQDGNVRKLDVPDVKIGKDGSPTPASLKKVYDSLSQTAGHGAEVQAVYLKGADEAKAEREVMTIANNLDREKYKLLTNSCKDFCNKVVNDSSSK